MKKSTIVWFIIGGALILAGGILWCLVMSSLGWNFLALDTNKYETNVYESESVITKVTVNTSTSDVVFKPSTDGRVRVECLEQEKLNHTVSFNSRELKIELEDTRKWYDYISLFSFEDTRVTVYLPTDTEVKMDIDVSTGDVKIPSDLKLSELKISVSTGDVECFASCDGDIKIKGTTGDVRLSGISADDINIEVSTGRIKLANVECETLTTVADTGDTKLTEVNVKEITSVKTNTGDVTFASGFGAELYVKTSSGDVRFENFDAREMSIETDTGDVTGTLLTSKVFTVNTTTGDVEVERYWRGYECKIKTTTGDVKIECLAIAEDGPYWRQ